MRFFHISDLHIGRHFHYYDMKEDQKFILESILDAVKREKPDAVLIAGDIYDRSVPSAEAVSLFDWFLTELSFLQPAVPVLIIAGNHDSAERLDYAGAILERQQIYIAGRPPVKPEDRIRKVTLHDSCGAVNFYLLPFVRPGIVRAVFPEGEAPDDYDGAVRELIRREQVDESERNVILSHQFYTAAGIPPEEAGSESVRVGGLDNVDISALKAFDYCALGHIHRRQQAGTGPAWYCGTPLQYSVSEYRDEKTLTMVELKEKGMPPVITAIPLHPLRQVRVLKGTLEEVLAGADEKLRQDYVSVVLTDEKELYEPVDRLEKVYPRLLEIRLEQIRTAYETQQEQPDLDLSDPLAVFEQFFEEMHGRSMEKEELALLKEIVKEALE